MKRYGCRRGVGACAACLLACLVLPAGAHPESLSVLTVMVEDQRVRAEMVLPVHALPALYPPTPGQRDQDYPKWAAAQLEKGAADALELRLNYAPVQPSNVRARAEDADTVVLEVDFPATTPTLEPVTTLQLFSNLVSKLGEAHRQVLEIHDGRGLPAPIDIDGGRVVSRHALTAGQFSAFVNLPPPGAPSTDPTTAPSARSEMFPAPPALSFFHLGVEHILTGYDHLLFLAALLLVCRTFGEAAKIITCFTMAHSITLALAALDVVRLSGRIVEPMIAASIVYVAAENVWQSLGQGGRHRVGRRMAITFGFGLVHGLGFASALREAGLGTRSHGLAWPLLQFNLGVEAGQLAVAAVVFPLILALRNHRPTFERRWVPACSGVVAVVGAWWLVTRIAGQ
jgi:hydrogenase/urease accessory protein HupE